MSAYVLLTIGKRCGCSPWHSVARHLNEFVPPLLKILKEQNQDRHSKLLLLWGSCNELW
jgi:hypothetical protein